MVARLLTAVMLALALASSAAGDVVRLKNGSAFEDVVATVVGDQVEIQLSFGKISLPAASVAEVSKADSEVADYLSRRDALLAADSGHPEAWLELARWARARGLRHGVREAALTAAALEPRLDGLAPLLRELGFVLDEEILRWVPYSDFMQRRGFVYSGGRWIGPEELAAERQERQAAVERQAEQRRADRAERIADIAELLLVREAMEAEPAMAAGFVGVPVVYAAPPAVVGFHGSSGLTASSRVESVSPFTANRQSFPDLMTRQPGSVLPLGGGSHRGGVRLPSQR